MKRRHLLWIVPLVATISGIIVFYSFSYLMDYTAWELTAQAASKLEDGVLAWEEIPLSDDRVYYNGEFCYMINDVPVCPKRNLTDLSLNG